MVEEAAVGTTVDMLIHSCHEKVDGMVQ
jgi:hypothetical protein